MWDNFCAWICVTVWQETESCRRGFNASSRCSRKTPTSAVRLVSQTHCPVTESARRLPALVPCPCRCKVFRFSSRRGLTLPWCRRWWWVRRWWVEIPDRRWPGNRRRATRTWAWGRYATLHRCWNQTLQRCCHVLHRAHPRHVHRFAHVLSIVFVGKWYEWFCCCWQFVIR